MSDPLFYKRFIGRLLYLRSTRLDISFPIQQLWLTQPFHFQAMMYVLKYLNGCPNKGLYFRHDSPIHIMGFSNGEWTNCTNSRRSVTGYCLFIGSSLVSWKTKKQYKISRFSFEVEYRTLAFTTW
ncbi:hypothetical protein VIGAN_04293300 [Vigna angularis var. angularis]|uniref:Reverse transcriptase Ty1/copia-type domain-containing protein n=1 Tax=Vigna angularis var. angularis TaxID=157739 RepID=A0A0S3RXU5_PHAAN|nr:hypothetical protein VIGAN_04293300 [Vigna angularis var. angularis]